MFIQHPDCPNRHFFGVGKGHTSLNYYTFCITQSCNVTVHVVLSKIYTPRFQGRVILESPFIVNHVGNSLLMFRTAVASWIFSFSLDEPNCLFPRVNTYLVGYGYGHLNSSAWPIDLSKCHFYFVFVTMNTIGFW